MKCFRKILAFDTSASVLKLLRQERLWFDLLMLAFSFFPVYWNWLALTLHRLMKLKLCYFVHLKDVPLLLSHQLLLQW